MADLREVVDRATGGASAVRALWLIWAIWLPYLVYPISVLFSSHQSPARIILTLLATAVFVALYLWTAWRFVARHTEPLPRAAVTPLPYWFPLAVLGALSLVVSLGDGKEWLQLFIYTSATVGICLPYRRAALVIAALMLLTAALGLVEHAGWSAIGQTAFVILITGFSVIVVVWLVAVNRALRLAREEIARLAVSEERLRFARDLHDLLGHSLSLIALKSELAGRLATAAPERAAAEMRDVEGVARTALQEVRAAVAGYRQPTLASELHGAEQLLAAAGVSCAVEGESGALPAAVEAALSWAVREGVTNVIRHSRARRCTIRLTGDATCAGVTVLDDGRGVEPGAVALAAVGGSGSGLAGLTERATALGGRCDAGPLSSGGFRLAVVLPIEQGGAIPPTGPDRGVGDAPAPLAGALVEAAGHV